MPLEDGALQVVVEKDTRHTAEVGEGLHVPGHEERHRRARRESQEQPARVAEHHDEGPQRTLGAADLELAEVRPVDLGLLARHRPQPLESLRRFSRAKAADEAPEMIGPAGVAALFDHDEQPARAEARDRSPTRGAPTRVGVPGDTPGKGARARPETASSRQRHTEASGGGGKRPSAPARRPGCRKARNYQ
jgi:hypothetical protein